jgi:hypothetical protein
MSLSLCAKPLRSFGIMPTAYGMYCSGTVLSCDTYARSGSSRFSLGRYVPPTMCINVSAYNNVPIESRIQVLYKFYMPVLIQIRNGAATGLSVINSKAIPPLHTRTACLPYSFSLGHGIAGNIVTASVPPAETRQSTQ